MDVVAQDLARRGISDDPRPLMFALTPAAERANAGSLLPSVLRGEVPAHAVTGCNFARAELLEGCATPLAVAPPEAVWQRHWGTMTRTLGPLDGRRTCDLARELVNRLSRRIGLPRIRSPPAWLASEIQMLDRKRVLLDEFAPGFDDSYGGGNQRTERKARLSCWNSKVLPQKHFYRCSRSREKVHYEDPALSSEIFGQILSPIAVGVPCL